MFTLNEVREAIKDKPEFKLNERPFGFVVDYQIEFEETFVGNTDRETMILTNLRGTCFNHSGKIIRLMYHKFKNLNQNAEYSADKFDFSAPHRIEEKLDGSLIAPIPFPDGHWEFGTRAGVTDVALKATAFMTQMKEADPHKGGQYIEFIGACLEMGITPMFEFIGREQRIVIDYQETKLVLTGMRLMSTGEYINCTTYPFAMVESVKTIADEHTSISDLAEIIKHWPGDAEGVVVKFDDGRYVKIKGAEYCLLHKTLDGLRFEKDVLRIVLENKLDDILPLVTIDMKDRLTKYSDSVNHFLQLHNSRMTHVFEEISKSAEGNRAAFAKLVKENPMYSVGMYKMFDGKAYDLREFILKKCSSSTDVESVRHFIGPSFNLF